MATIPELRPPDVEVIQVFTASTPSKIRPALMACMIGPCKQFLQPMTSAGAINSDAICTLPAFAISSNTSFTGLGGKRIKVGYKTYTEEEMTFAATPANPTAAQVVEQINLEELTGLSAQLIPDGANYRVMIYTTANGELETFKFVDPAADDGTAILGFTKYESYFGMGSYNQCDIRLPDILFPDPSGNLDELILDRTSVRVYVNTSGTRTTEAKDDESILAPYNTAELIGTVAINGLTYPDDLMDKVLEMTLSTESEKSVTFFATLRAKIIAGYNEAAAKYTLHIAKGIGTHPGGADATNTLTFASLASTATLADIVAAWTDFLATYNAHDADGIPTWHGAAGPKSAIGAGAPVTWADCITFYNAVVTAVNGHLEEVGGGYHTAVDPDDGLILPVIWLYNEFATDYANHLTDSAAGLYDLNFHKAEDGTDTLTASSLAESATFTDVCNAWDDVKAKYNAHDAAAAYHKLGAAANAVAEAAATTLVTLYDLADTGATSCRTKYEAHRASGTEHYIRDAVNSVTLTSTLVNVSQTTVVAEVNATWANVTASLDANRLKLVSTLGGITMGDGTANAVIGYTDSDYEFVAEAIDDGDADTQTPYIRVENADFTAAAAAASVTGTLDLTADFPYSLDGLTFELGEDGTHLQTVEFTAAAVDIATVVSEINAVMGAGFASNAANYLKFTSSTSGYESKIYLGNGTAQRNLGHLTNTSYYGTAFVPVPGDELWQNGSRVAEITQVAPGGNVDRLKLATEISTSYAKAHCYIIAKDLTGAASRPTADLASDGYYFDVKHDIVRDYSGQPSAAGGQLLVSYQGLRKDVTPEADDPSLLIFNTTSEVEATIPPMDDTNPLALAAYYGLLNAPATQIAAIGVAETSADYADGTLEGYAACLEFLEAYDVYSLVPLTQETDVHGAVLTHALAMSDPLQKMERIGIVNPALPTREMDTVVVSGNEGESTATLNQFETAVPDLVTLLVTEGVNPAALAYTDGVYLDIERNSLRYNLSSVVGTIATVRVTFGAGENTDNFFTTTNLPTDLLAESFSVKIRGAEISTKDEQVEAYYYRAKGYASRRMVQVVPDRVVATVSGVDKNLPAYYMAAAVGGQIGQQNPSQPMTKLPVTGFKGLQHSFPYFNQTQLNQIAAGGNYIFVQDTSGGPIYCRHQLTTDTTSIKTRELSITKAVDYAAKYYRLTVKGFAGPYNITPETYDALAMAMQAATENLIEDKVIYGAEVGAPTQSTSEEDKTEIQVALTVFTPNNTITITLVV